MRRLAGRDLSQLDLSDIKYLRDNEDPGYRDALRALVNETDILSDRQLIPSSEEIFEDGAGNRKPVRNILEALAGRNLDVVGDRVADGGYINSAGPRAFKRGEFHADLGAIPHVMESGGVPSRVKDVARWADDPAMAAYLDPDNASPGNNSKLLRAVEMGLAASRGDRDTVMSLQKRYDFSPEEVQEFLAGARIGSTKFGSSVKKQGLDQGREAELIHPVTGKLVKGSPEEQAFYDDREEQLTRSWLESGGTSFLESGSEIGVPGFHNQMEHDIAFSRLNPQGLAEVPSNRPGFYERYANSEKNDIDPTEYYQMQRLAYLANKEGIDISGVVKGPSAEESLQIMLNAANPVTVMGDRRKKDYTVENFPEREAQNNALIKRAMTPAKGRKAGDSMTLDKDGHTIHIHKYGDHADTHIHDHDSGASHTF